MFLEGFSKAFGLSFAMAWAAESHFSSDDLSGVVRGKARPCLLCLARANTFYCGRCVAGGQFSHSDQRFPEMLAEKKVRKEAIEMTAKHLEEDIRERHATAAAAEELREKIRLARQRVKYLGRLVKEKEDQAVRTRQAVQRSAASNRQRAAHLPRFNDKVSRIGRAAAKYDAEVKRQQMTLTRAETSLAFVRREIARDLTKLILPIEECQLEREEEGKTGSSNNAEEDGESPKLERLLEEDLADAMSTTFMNGQWVTQSLTCLEKKHYRFGSEGPHLPASGDYSAFNAFKALASDAQADPANSAQDAKDHDINPARIISASLTFTTANWDQAQTVTVTGVDDDIIDGQQTATITLAVNGCSG